MKHLAIIVIILLLGNPVLAQEPEVIECVLTTPTVATCKDSKGKERLIGPIDWSAEAFSEWTAYLEHPDATPTKVIPVVGQKLKAVEEGSSLFALADCTTRINRRVKTWANNHPGDRVPFAMWTPPEDCQPWYEKQ